MTEIRKATRSDAEQIVKVIKSAEDSGYMLFDPGEREIAAEPFAEFIGKINENEKSGVFIASKHDRILGYMIVQNEKAKRTSHRAYIVVGIHRDSRGQGIGKALFSYVISWAKNVDLHRLDLTVLVHNEAAVALYKKMGFEIEGVKRDSLLIDHEYADEYYMSKLI